MGSREGFKPKRPSKSGLSCGAEGEPRNISSVPYIVYEVKLGSFNWVVPYDQGKLDSHMIRSCLWVFGEGTHSQNSALLHIQPRAGECIVKAG